jgi:hypothetical protein
MIEGYREVSKVIESSVQHRVASGATGLILWRRGRQVGGALAAVNTTTKKPRALACSQRSNVF